MTVKERLEQIKENYSYVKVTTNQGSEILDAMDFTEMIENNGVADIDYNEYQGTFEGYEE
jgi:hypothetical protein